MAFARKYGNKKYTVDGITFDSIREAHRFQELKALQNAGIIHDLKRQVKFVLIPAQYEKGEGVYRKGKNKGNPKAGRLLERECSYYADFTYLLNGELVVEDAKGFQTQEYKIKRKMMLFFHGIQIQEV